MSRRRQAIVTVAWAVLIVMGLATGAAVHRLWKFRAELEKLADRMTLDVGPESTLLYDDNNNLISALFEQHRIAIGLDQMSPYLINAVLATEDKRFYDHDGIDLRRIAAAFVANQQAGEIVEGGSTITQQLVRSIVLDRDRTYGRKVREAILARRLEERYSKREILEAYLNRVYLGDGYYGVEAASIGYFGKPASELEPAEAATLAGLIKGPSIYAPTKDAGACARRRDLVLELMHEDGLLSDQEFSKATAIGVQSMLARTDTGGMPDPRHAHGAEYFRDAVSRELVAMFGAEAVYTGGLRVFTTLDRDLQRLAEDVIASRVRGLSHGGDPLQGALVAIDPRTGFVRAVVGGRSFHESPYNRAIEARRQPGSAFKPFIYAVALESGLSPGSMIDGLDQPIPTQQGPWLPGGEHEAAAISLRNALALSSNRAAAHLLQQVGIHRTLDLVQQLGVTSPLPAVPSLALGSGEMTLYELTSAYGVFANRGVWKAPTMIRRVVDRYGREVYTAPEGEHRVLSETTAYMMASMMSDVLDYGTGATARSAGFRLHAAGKTGTSQDYSDAWFIGFTPTLATGVWFGYDKPKPIMNRGFASVVAVPAWARFMSAALRGANDEWLEMPGGLVKVRICRLSGMQATDRCHEPVYEQGPYDPDHPELMATTVREGGVYEDVMPADRVPPPCTLPHGEPPATLQPPSYYDPSMPAPGVQRAAGDELGTAAPVAPAAGTAAAGAPAAPAVNDPTRPPVAQPPAFMTERPSRVTTIVPSAAAPRPKPRPDALPLPATEPGDTAAAKTAAPKPDTSTADVPRSDAKRPPAEPNPTPNPILPASPDPDQPREGPVIPGSIIDKAPPAAPKKPKEPPQFQPW